MLSLTFVRIISPTEYNPALWLQNKERTSFVFLWENQLFSSRFANYAMSDSSGRTSVELAKWVLTSENEVPHLQVSAIQAEDSNPCHLEHRIKGWSSKTSFRIPSFDNATSFKYLTQLLHLMEADNHKLFFKCSSETCAELVSWE